MSSVAQGLDETPQKQCCNDTKAHDETSSGGHFHFHWFDYLESRVVLVNYYCSKCECHLKRKFCQICKIKLATKLYGALHPHITKEEFNKRIVAWQSDEK